MCIGRAGQLADRPGTCRGNVIHKSDGLGRLDFPPQQSGKLKAPSFPGKLADLDLIAGDPIENIATVRNVVLTVKDGNLYNPAELDAALGIAPR
jgi:hypothetical protein